MPRCPRGLRENNAAWGFQGVSGTVRNGPHWAVQAQGPAARRKAAWKNRNSSDVN